MRRLITGPISLVFFVLFYQSCKTDQESSATLQSSPMDSGSFSYFCDSDQQCRANLVSAIAERKNAEYWKIALPGSAQNPGDELAIDFAYFTSNKYNDTATEDKSNLLILTSGIHGTEGFVSSAIQHLFIREMLDQVLQQGTNVLIIHGINSYGFRHKSRFTKNRVDLNRNWFVPDQFPGTNFDGTFYKKYENLLNPRKPATFGKLDFANYVSTSIVPYIRSALNGSVTRAAGEGQYQIPDGISFGGKNYEPNYFIVKNELSKYLPLFNHIIMLDLHTGLGKKQLQLLPNPPYSVAVGERRNIIFSTKGRSIEETGGAEFYASHGDFSDFVCQFAETFSSTKSCTNMLIEYGTLLHSDFDQQTLKAGLQDKKALIYTLYITTRENQREHFGSKTANEDAAIKEAWEQMFNPKDQEWRNMVLKETRELFPQYFQNFTTLAAKK